MFLLFVIDPATTELYTLSLHDALPISGIMKDNKLPRAGRALISDSIATTVGAVLGTSTTTSYIESSAGVAAGARTGLDRKSARLNSSHSSISYAVFCLKKKRDTQIVQR